jgi:ribosome-binding ATPase YchF (GTP1/OBG family)
MSKEGAYWVFINDLAKVQVVCHVVSLMEQKVIRHKESYLDFAYDLLEVSQ